MEWGRLRSVLLRRNQTRAGKLHRRSARETGEKLTLHPLLAHPDQCRLEILSTHTVRIGQARPSGRACLFSPALISTRCRNRSAYARSTCGLTAKAVCLVVIQAGDTALHI